MSRNEWEEGEVKLPAAEFARVRKAVADAITDNSDRVYDHAQAFWKTLTAKEKRDWAAYRDAYTRYEREWEQKHRWDGKQLPDGLARAVQGHEWWPQGAPKRVLKEHLNYPTNRDTGFAGEDGGGYLSFRRDENTVRWSVSENNHAVDSARGTLLFQAFHSALRAVKWTRGTGGYFTGNDEGAQDSRDFGGGANYITEGFGPIGAADAPWQTQPYTMADGTKVQAGDFDKVRKQMQAASRRHANKAFEGQGRLGNGTYTFKSYRDGPSLGTYR